MECRIKYLYDNIVSSCGPSQIMRAIPLCFTRRAVSIQRCMARNRKQPRKLAIAGSI